MEYVKIPNLPAKAVKLVLADRRINNETERNLAARGTGIIKVSSYKGIYNAIACHPDIMLHHLGDEYMVYAPGTDPVILDELKKLGFKLIKGNKHLDMKYPGNIAYNAARVGNYVFHNLSYMDDVLKAELEKRNVELINIRQGYAKCSISIVDENSIITSDKGIAKAGLDKGLDVLLIEPEKAIRLHELEYGFIGGSTGLLDRNLWALSGSLENLDSKSLIKDFLQKKGIQPISLYDGSVTDIGSLIPIGL